MENEIVIYQDKDKKIEVSLKEETIWLTQKQISVLFDVDRSVVTKHIRNIFKTGELNEKSVCAIFAHTASDGKTYKTKFYNLDVIISVGYRVNSKKATMFRIWATNVLKNYLVKGYAINENKLTQERLKELENTIKLIKNTIYTSTLTASEVKGLLEIIEKYANTWKWIEEFDTGKIKPSKKVKEKEKLTYEKAKKAINHLKDYLIKHNEAPDIFGKERDKGLFLSAINGIYQTFDGKELYPSVEEKAANLLYFVIKNHPFVDGNKRIGALMFLMFLYDNLGFDELITKFNNNALTALCYLVAGSRPDQKEVLVNLITQMIGKR